MPDIKEFLGRKVSRQLPKSLGKQLGIKVDINSLEDMCCIKCGCIEYEGVTRIKKLPATISPNGQEGNINLNMLRCKECGWQFDVQEWEKAKKEHQDLCKDSKVPEDYEDEDTVSMNENIPLKDTVKAEEPPEEDNRELCRKCGTFYEKGTDHDCK